MGAVRNSHMSENLDMARPQVANGRDGLQILRAATNISNKQSRTDEKGWSSSLRIEREANNSPP